MRAGLEDGCGFDRLGGFCASDGSLRFLEDGAGAASVEGEISLGCSSRTRRGSCVGDMLVETKIYNFFFFLVKVARLIDDGRRISGAASDLHCIRGQRFGWCHDFFRNGV